MTVQNMQRAIQLSREEADSMAMKVERKENEHKKEKASFLAEISSMKEQFSEVANLKETIQNLENAKMGYE